MIIIDNLPMITLDSIAAVDVNGEPKQLLELKFKNSLRNFKIVISNDKRKFNNN